MHTCIFVLNVIKIFSSRYRFIRIIFYLNNLGESIVKNEEEIMRDIKLFNLTKSVLDHYIIFKMTLSFLIFFFFSFSSSFSFSWTYEFHKGKIDDTDPTSNFHLNETTFALGVSIRSLLSPVAILEATRGALSNFRPKFNCLLLAFYLNSSSLAVANFSNG